MKRNHGPWLAALVLVVAALAAINWTWQSGDEANSFRNEMASHAKMILVQYAVGERAGQNSYPAAQLKAMERSERSKADRIYRAIVEAEVGTRQKAFLLLESLPPEMKDGPVLLRLYGGGELTDGEREGLIERWGWFGRLAGVFGLEKGDPKREKIWGPLHKTAGRWVVVMTITLPALFAGLVLFVVVLVKLKRGRLSARFALHDEGSGDLPWLAVVVLGLAAFLLLGIGAFRYVRIPRQIVMWVPLLALLWPLARGMRWRELVNGLGLVLGDGLPREIAAGVVGYVAGLPLIVLGMLVTAQLSEITGWNPTHPMQYETVEGAGTPTWSILLAACVWAPLVEETLIRGAFYRYLRPRYSVVGAASISALLFAVIHPQGLVAIPAIWTIGVVLAGLREWRGSVVAPMAAHALHNGALVTMLLTILH